ncbi:hypothetical protein C4K08_4097 [Pseudomonas chlororaphis subsp. aureofaciens]|nr:hypothetical protein C4K08_4097 [Pseudomonas chlororaphis subsp. aureofaciens]
MSAIAKGRLRIWINKLSVTVIERLGAALSLSNMTDGSRRASAFFP